MGQQQLFQRNKKAIKALEDSAGDAQRRGGQWLGIPFVFRGAGAARGAPASAAATETVSCVVSRREEGIAGTGRTGTFVKLGEDLNVWIRCLLLKAGMKLSN